MSYAIHVRADHLQVWYRDAQGRGRSCVYRLGVYTACSSRRMLEYWWRLPQERTALLTELIARDELAYRGLR